jgi:hypothetical protein
MLTAGAVGLVSTQLFLYPKLTKKFGPVAGEVQHCSAGVGTGSCFSALDWFFLETQEPNGLNDPRWLYI